MLARAMDTTTKSQLDQEKVERVQKRVKEQIEIGRRVKDLLDRPGAEVGSMAVLAERVKADPTTLSRIFNGDKKRKLSGSLTKRIAATLGVSAETLNPNLNYQESAVILNPGLGVNLPGSGSVRETAIRNSIATFEQAHPGYLTTDEREDLRKMLEVSSKVSPTQPAITKIAQAIKLGAAAQLDQ